MSSTKHVRVELQDLTAERLDTGFYSAEYFTARRAYTESGFSVRLIGELCEPWCFGAYALTSEIEWADADGIPFFKAESLGAPMLDEAGLSYVTSATHEKLSKSRLGPGDLVVSTSGTIGRVAVVPQNMPTANSNQDTIKFNPRSAEIDNHFLAAQLSSSFGQAFMAREAGGAVQQHIYLFNFKRLPLFLPDSIAQAYIGNKVRQAEELRATSQELVADGLHRVESLYPWLWSVADTKKISRVSATELNGRFNAEAYAPEYLEDEHLLQALDIDRVELGKLVDESINNSIRNVTDALLDENASIPMFRPADIDGMWLNLQSTPLLPRAFESKHEKSRVFHGDIVLGIAGSVGVAGRVPPLEHHGNINGSSARLRVKPPFRGYLLLLLNTALGRRLMMRWSVGAVQKHLNLVDLPGVRIPVPSDKRILDDLNRMVDTAESARLASRALTAAARLLVEALIERKVTEADLVAAHKSPDADRALLARLTSAGLDAPEGKPLFPDLDRLDELLAQSQADPRGDS